MGVEVLGTTLQVQTRRLSPKSQPGSAQLFVFFHLGPHDLQELKKHVGLIQTFSN